MASIVGSNNNKVFCNCGDTSGPGNNGAMECCHVVELGVVYEQEPDLSDVCGMCTRENAQFRPASEPPHGKISDWRRACARLIVFTKVDSSVGSLSYEERFLYYSRQVGQLPGPSVCENLPIICPAENGLYTCCPVPIPNWPGTALKARGVCQKCDQPLDPSCSGEAKVLHEYSLTPCQLSSGGFMAGYAYAPDDWWFLDSGEFGEITYQIVENNPYYTLSKPFYHTVYVYLQVESKYISCCNWKCGEACYTPPSNFHAGRCGTSNWLGMRDKELRERSVRIYAAIGYASNSCGYTPESACLLAASVPP